MSPADDLDTLLGFYSVTEQSLEGAEAPLFRVQPERSGWSPAAHLYHIELVCRGALGAIRRIQQDGPDATPAEETRLGRVTLNSGRFPRGRAQAPEAVAPPKDFTREALSALVSKNRVRWEALRPELGGLAALPGGFSHPMLGPLTAAGWIRFARIHTAHHHGIVEELMRGE